MISMKIEIKDKKTYIYLYKYLLDFDNIDNLNKEVKNIFIKLIKKYKLDFFGYSKVDIYENKKYGCIMEIDRIESNDFYLDIIDLKLVIHRNTPFYLEFDDYYFDSLYKNIFIQNGKYYLNINDLDNLMKYLEYGKIVYKIN